MTRTAGKATIEAIFVECGRNRMKRVVRALRSREAVKQFPLSQGRRHSDRGRAVQSEAA